VKKEEVKVKKDKKGKKDRKDEDAPGDKASSGTTAKPMLPMAMARFSKAKEALAKAEAAPSKAQLKRQRKKEREENPEAEQAKPAGKPSKDAKAPAPAPEPEEPEQEEYAVYVDGLPYEWSEEDIKKTFEPAGKVSSILAPRWQDTGRLRGFCHVRFTTIKAQKAALAMTGMTVTNGMYLRIQEPTGVRKMGGEVKNREAPYWCKTLFVKNLPYDAMEEEIAQIFRQFDKVRQVRVVTRKTPEGRISKGWAFVDFFKPEGVKRTLAEAQNLKLRGRFLTIDFEANPPKAGFHFRPEAVGAKFGVKARRPAPTGESAE